MPITMNGMNPGLPMQAGQNTPAINQPMQGQPQAGPQGAPMPAQGMQGQPPAPQPMPDPSLTDQLDHGTDPQQLSVDRMLEQTNIAEHLKDEELVKMGDVVWRGYKTDLDSKAKWDRDVDQWVKLAAQVREQRTWPWPKASNVKFPLLSTASMQFAARAYPSLVPSDGKVVQMQTIGVDPTGQKANLADKLAKHMNFQLMYDMPDWEEEMDKLLIQLPIVGCLFKKTYFDDVYKRNCSRLLGPKDLVVNYWARSLNDAYRVSEIIYMTKNDIQTMINAGLYLDVDLPDPSNLASPAPEMYNVAGMVKPATNDETTPYVIIEQHTYWELDDDGYAEPCIITIEESTKKVLRVVARWDSDGVMKNADGKTICIEPVQYYTKFSFIPNPDGGFYDIGFGHLLGPLNETSNSLINLLVDAGTLSNLQSGFMGKGLRTKQGETRLAPGEWRMVNATGDDLRKQIVPIPAKEPSDVLFKLLGLLVENTEKLASVAEIFVGKMPGQNTPATTTMATIEQGMKVFTAIYKRVYRSLALEFRKIFRLNGLYQENIQRAMHILDEPISIMDYDEKSYNVCPVADPTAVSSTQKLLKAQGLMELLQLGTIDPVEVTKRILDAQEQPNPEALLRQGPPPPDPKTQQIQAELQADQERHQMDMQRAQVEMAREQYTAAQQAKAADQNQQMKLIQQQQDMRLQAADKIGRIMAQDAAAKHSMAMDAAMGAQDMVQKQQDHNQGIVHEAQKHAQQLKHNEELAHAKARAAARVAKSSSHKPSAGGSKRKG